MRTLFVPLALAAAMAPAAAAAETPDIATQLSGLASQIDWYWTCVAAFLVFFMQAGFALVESGFTRAKNTVNILMKNLMDFSVGAIAFWAVGFGLMFSATTGLFGWGEFFPNPDVNAFGEDPNWMYSFLIFQTVFAATAATIVSGAMAERTRFSSYLIYSVVITGIIYPITGSWAWGGLWHGGGWLEGLGFVDFAGSTVVHSVGGWAALAGAIVLGARKGKFNPDGSANAIVGHSMPLAAMGVFILWLGWFGFNAGCYTMTPIGGLLTGFLAGILVVFSVLFFDRIKVDDPVGAISVHGVCGAWGTFACAIPLFCRPGEAASVATQLTGIGAIFLFTFVASLALFSTIKATFGLRVSPEDEEEGLDLAEHGMSAYHDQSLDSLIKAAGAAEGGRIVIEPAPRGAGVNPETT